MDLVQSYTNKTRLRDMSFLTFSRHFNKLYINRLAKTQRMFAQMWEISPYHQKKRNVITNIRIKSELIVTLAGQWTPRWVTLLIVLASRLLHVNTFTHSIRIHTLLVHYLHSGGWTSFLNYNSYLDFIDNNSSFFFFLLFFFSLQFTYNASNA